MRVSDEAWAAFAAAAVGSLVGVLVAMLIYWWWS